jgi:hypothetical protein
VTEQASVPMKDYVDQRLASLQKLGAAVAGALIACTWIAFSLNGKALRVALDSNNREVESHNGKIREWEVERGEREAKLATKADIEPLKVDYEQRRGSAVAAGRFWGALVIVGTFAIAIGFGLANLIGAAG